MKEIKPKKRAIIYWFVEYGFFFLSASFLVLTTYLKYTTTFYYLINFFFYLALGIFYLGTAFVAYKWSSTNYFFLEKNLFIKEGKNSYQIPYNSIKTVKKYRNLLQKLLGSSNIYIKTYENKKYYIRGINPKIVESELFKKIN